MDHSLTLSPLPLSLSLYIYIYICTTVYWCAYETDIYIYISLCLFIWSLLLQNISLGQGQVGLRPGISSKFPAEETNAANSTESIRRAQHLIIQCSSFVHYIQYSSKSIKNYRNTLLKYCKTFDSSEPIGNLYIHVYI